jgi:hypothetical protein
VAGSSMSTVPPISTPEALFSHGHIKQPLLTGLKKHLMGISIFKVGTIQWDFGFCNSLAPFHFQSLDAIQSI